MRRLALGGISAGKQPQRGAFSCWEVQKAENSEAERYQCEVRERSAQQVREPVTPERKRPAANAAGRFALKQPLKENDQDQDGEDNGEIELHGCLGRALFRELQT